MKRRKNTGRVLAGILAVVMLVSAMPSAVYAVENESGATVAAEQEKTVPEETVEEAGQESAGTEPVGKEDNESGEETSDPTDTTPKEDKEDQEEIEVDSEQTEEDDEAGEEETAGEEATLDKEDELETDVENQTSVSGAYSGSVKERLAAMSAEGDIASGVVDDNFGKIAWVIDKNGKLTVEGTGDYGDGAPPWRRWAESIVTAEISVEDMTSAASLFDKCNNLVSVDLSHLNTSKIRSMISMFGGCSNLKNLDIIGFDTGNVEIMEGMFLNCSSLTSLDVSHFDTGKVTDMSAMFSGCSSLAGLDVSHFDTGKVVDMSYIFSNCRSLASLDVGHFDTGKVENMYAMFSGCSSLASLDVSHFDTSEVVYMGYMFSGCSKLVSLDLSGLDTGKAELMNGMFSGCSNMISLDISGFDTSKAEHMYEMFSGCSNLTSLDVSHFDTANVTSMVRMFKDCSSLTSLDVSHFDTGNVAHDIGYINASFNSMQSMFSGCSNLTSLDVSHFETGKVADMSYMFSDCSSLTSLDVSHFETGKVADMSSMFSGCSSLTSLNLSSFDTGNVGLDYVGWNSYGGMDSMFRGCGSLASLDLSSFNTGNVKNMGCMFLDCSSLTSLDLSSFNTSNVKNMDSMFRDCSSLTGLNLSSFNTDNVENMQSMFSGCSSLTSLDVSSFNTGNVEDMGCMFCDCSNLTSLDLTHFDTGNVVAESMGGYFDGGMQSMFSGCSSLTSLDLSSFNTSNVVNMDSMFSDCSSLVSLNLSSFNTSNVVNMDYMFRGCSSLASLSLSSFNTSNVIYMASMFDGCSGLLSLDISSFDGSRADVDGLFVLSSCSSLTSVKLPKNLSEIVHEMFKGCSSLENVNIPNSVTKIGDGAFSGCTGLTSVNIPGRVTHIGSDAFLGCTGLTSVNISGSVTEIGDSAFLGCTGLTSVNIPGNVTEIGSNVFLGCTGLTNITIQYGVTEISSRAFSGCIGLTNVNIPGSVTYIGSYAFSGCTGLISITIQDGVAEIGSFAFSECTNLTSIEIPKSVIRINYAFGGCDNLNDIYYGGSESDWREIDINYFNAALGSAKKHYAWNDSKDDNLKWSLDVNGVLTISGIGKMADYHNSDSPAPWSGKRDQIKTVIISQGVTSIGASAFFGCTNLTEITIPKSVVSIGDSAFSGCENLARVKFLGTKKQLENIAVGTDNEPYHKASRSWIESGADEVGPTDISNIKINGKSIQSLFSKSSFTYDENLALFAALLSQKAEDKTGDKILNFYSSLEWPDEDREIYQYGGDRAYSIACAKLSKDENLLVITARGSQTGSEFFEDGFSFGHRDFFGYTTNDVIYDFERDIMTGLNQFLDSHEYLMEKDLKILITGHSLGGAAANLNAARFTMFEDSGAWWSDLTEQSDIYCYTFGAINSLSDNSPVKNGFENIHNIYNVLDSYGPCRCGYMLPSGLGRGCGKFGHMDMYSHNYETGLYIPFADNTNHLIENYIDSLNKGYVSCKNYAAFTIHGGCVKCPVNFKIYLETTDGQVLVGSITDNQIDEVEHPMVGLRVEGDKKYFYFPDDGNYIIELEGTDIGTMTYFVQDMDAETGEPVDDTGIVYRQVQLAAGKQFYSDVKIQEGVLSGILTEKVPLYVLDKDGKPEKEVLPDGNGTEIPYTGFGDVLPGDLPADGKIPDGLWIAGVKASYTYTGTAIKPEIRVYDGKTRLQSGKDYTASYKNNTKVNNAAKTSAAPTITVKGKGNYAGTETATFQITAVNLSDSIVSAEDITIAYNKKVQKKVPVVTYNGKKLAANRDFTVSYPNGGEGAYKEAGTYDILLTAKSGGNFSGTRTVKCTITENTLLSKVTVKKIPVQVYTGEAIEPELTVTYKGAPLVKDTDYSVSYTDNTEIGTAKAILTGIGKYAGTKNVSFSITGTSLKGASVSGIENKIYNGCDQEQRFTVTLKGKTLTEGTDYDVSYEKNKNVGKANVTIKGKGTYTGTIRKTFAVEKFNIAANADGRFEVKLEQDVVPYAKGGAKPEVTVRFKTGDEKWEMLAEGKDYILSYRNHTAVNDGSNRNKQPVVTVKGKGSFSGTYGTTLPYKIVAQDLGQLRLTAQDKTYQNKKNVYATRITITDLDGKTLKPGTDYDKALTYSYANETTVNTAGNGTIVRTAGDFVDKNDVIPAGTILRVQAEAGSGGNYAGTLSGEYRIVQASVSSASVSVPKQIYTGRAITLEKSRITVRIKGKQLDESQYEIVPNSYKNNVKKGTATVTIRGLGNYGGTKDVKFTIKAKGFLWWWR